MDSPSSAAHRIVTVAALLSMVACGPTPDADAGAEVDGGSATDSGLERDAGSADAGDGDAASPDAGVDLDAGAGADAGGLLDSGPPPDNAHPLYPVFDLDSLPAPCGSGSRYTPPTLPLTTREVTLDQTGAAAAAALSAECRNGAVAVTVPDAAGALGTVSLGGASDCDITLGPDVEVSTLNIGTLPSMHAPTRRVRIRGGQLGRVLVTGGSADLVLDGVTINSGIVAPSMRAGGAFHLGLGPLGEVVQRFAVVRSVVRLVAVSNGAGATNGSGFNGLQVEDVFFADNNIATAGNLNAWGFRFNGARNVVLVDNTVRVNAHKFVRMNTEPVENVLIRGGLWMREATATPSGMRPNDSFQQLQGATTNCVTVEDTTLYSRVDTPLGFGPRDVPQQSGLRWDARRIDFFALNSAAVSVARMQALESACVGVCDFAPETHTFTYDADLQFPANPWRTLPGLAQDDPDALPVVP